MDMYGDAVTDEDGDLVDEDGNKVATDENGHIMTTEESTEAETDSVLLRKLRLAAIITGSVLAILSVILMIC